jgi:hypothetical protein
MKLILVAPWQFVTSALVIAEDIDLEKLSCSIRKEGDTLKRKRKLPYLILGRNSTSLLLYFNAKRKTVAILKTATAIWTP